MDNFFVDLVIGSFSVFAAALLAVSIYTRLGDR